MQLCSRLPPSYALRLRITSHASRITHHAFVPLPSSAAMIRAMPEYLNILQRPKMRDATMLLALTGWMDGGLVSTGTVRHFMSLHKVIELARIDPDPFYIYNFPGSMEIAAIFRPEAKYEEGLITDIQMPSNIFHCDPEANLVFFLGQEPNLRWQAFADCIFAVAKEAGVTR